MYIVVSLIIFGYVHEIISGERSVKNIHSNIIKKNIAKINFISNNVFEFYLQLNLSAEYVGLIFLIYPAVYAVTAPLWGWICDVKVSEHFAFDLFLKDNFLLSSFPFFFSIKI